MTDSRFDADPFQQREAARLRILDALEPLFEEAERTGRWFYSTYRGLWFSPEELREAHDEGRFIWGPDNWKLRDPEERLDELERKKQQVEEDLKHFREKLAD